MAGECFQSIGRWGRLRSSKHNFNDGLMLMRAGIISVAVIAAALFAAPVTAANRQDAKDCGQYSDLDRKIAGCTRLLNAGNITTQQRAIVHNSRGLAWENKGGLDRAITQPIPTRHSASTLNWRKPYANRGEAWQLKGNLDRALADQDQGIRLDPKSQLALVLRGNILRYRGEFDRALSDYDKALGIEPDYIPAITGRGLTYERMGDFARARVEFKKALASHNPLLTIANYKSAQETAQARLAALNSGAAQPIIPAAPSHATSPTSIPTPSVAVPLAGQRPSRIRVGALPSSLEIRPTRTLPS